RRRSGRRGRGGGVMDIHAVSLHSPDESGLAGARHLDRRVTMAEAAIEAVSGADEPTLVALPAGFLRVGTKLARDTLALSLLSISRRAQVPLAFGVDVAPDDTWAPIAGAPASFAY